MVSKIRILFLILGLILLIPVVIESEALLQKALPMVYELSPGESMTLQWGLKLENEKNDIALLRVEGEGSELVSFPETVQLLPNQWVRFDITVTVPEDHPDDVFFEPDVFALLKGEEGGLTVFNIQMKKSIMILIGNPIIPEEEEVVVMEPKETAETEMPEVAEEKVMEKASLTIQATEEEEGGGCLISTATYGSELAPQVQMLREIRDNNLLSTESGSTFMTGFNTLYYSFSPTIADWERQSPIFREVVQITITPLITSLSILNYVDMDSEAEVLGYGVALIMLNIGMYFVAPALLITKLRKI